ncbi:MAG: HNH endonuclease [Thalassospira sp.]|uniref:HNH endonuclease n=1 Tax=Thalassospira sp. TaxID=1912094 RepID=UPI003A84DA65
MRPINKASIAHSDVYSACSKSIRDQTTSRKLINNIPLTEKTQVDYDKLAKKSNFLTHVKTNQYGNLSNVELTKIYRNTFIKSAKTKDIISTIKTRSPHGICPICGANAAKTLDHYLPESIYTHLILLPENLIPCCGDCNKYKSSHTPKSYEQQTLNPYYDHHYNIRWLHASILPTKPIVFSFKALPPLSLEEKRIIRIEHHFKKFKLDDTLSIFASNELGTRKYELKNTKITSGADGLRKSLYESAESAAHHQINSWQTAAYEAMAMSDWFIHHGIDQEEP